MILMQDEQLPIGYRGEGINIVGKRYEQPFIVIREATAEEFLEQLVEQDVPLNMIPPSQRQALVDGTAFYYLVSVD